MDKNKEIEISIIFASALIVLTVIFQLFRPVHPLTLFIMLFILERIYESYYTTKKKASKKLTQDKYLTYVMRSYVIMLLASISEFYFFWRHTQWIISIFGMVILALSYWLRISSIKSIGRGWAIDTFAVPESICQIGPYRYIRHPYYVGVFLEAMAFPIILNAWMSLVFSFVVVIPLEGLRSFLEESNLVENFGWQYIKFKREVNQFIPTLARRVCYDRRNNILSRRDFDRRRFLNRRTAELDFSGFDRRRIIKG